MAKMADVLAMFVPPTKHRMILVMFSGVMGDVQVVVSLN